METIYNIENNEISDNNTIMDALNRLQTAKPKILFVTDKDKRLLSSVTDGDIRRAILSGVSLNDKISSIAKHSPVSLSEKSEENINAIAHEIMSKLEISAIPIVDTNGVITKIISRYSEAIEPYNKVNVPVIIMAGGKGTRLYPFTKILPKPLIPVEDVPISERIIKQLHKNGCNDFYMIVNYKKNMIKAYYNECNHPYNIFFYDEDEPLGTGGGIKLAQNTIKSTFILTNCDILITESISDILKHHKNENNAATMICSLKNYEIPYGVVNFSEKGEVTSLEEKPKMSFFTNTGYYILEPVVFDYIKDNESIGMPDILNRMKDSGLRVGVYPIGENSWLDMGQFDSLSSMEAYLRDNRI